MGRRETSLYFNLIFFIFILIRPLLTTVFIHSFNQLTISLSLDLEHQRCPFEGAYTIETPIESDLTYTPSNIFICPRQSFLTAQCDDPSRLRIHSKCSPVPRFLIKSKYLTINVNSVEDSFIRLSNLPFLFHP